MVSESSAAPGPPRLLLLGPCQLHAEGVVHLVPERRHQLLVLLALHQGEWVARDALAGLLWPQHAEGEGRRNLRKVVFAARAVPGAGGLEANEHALRWAVDSDVAELTRAVREGRFADAARLRRGTPLAGLADADAGALADWLAAERARLENTWHAAALAALHALAEPEARAVAARRLLDVDACDESAVAALIEAELALGRRAEAQASYRRYAQRLADELGVEPSQALRELLREPVRRAPAATPGAAAVEPAGKRADGRADERTDERADQRIDERADQPADQRADEPADQRFVGRRLELAELASLLAEPAGRLFTVLGPGGIGKSRLARQVLRGRAAGFEDGWRWIGLEDLDGPAGVVARIAQALGAPPSDSADPLVPLLHHLGDAPWRLVLDNAEHLVELPALLQRLLDGAPGLRLLVTSRSRLQLRGEWVLPLAGLAVPDADSRDLEAASAFDAVRLFEQRARSVQHGFRLAEHLDAVVAIVDAVGGMPLAIELAAGWVRLLPPAQVAQDLASSIDVLERDPAAQAQPARPEHASLRAVLDGSWRLLAPRERAALAALAVFEGGFTRAAALAVAGCSLPLLSSLVDKSLLAVDEGGRFALHPVVATYAAERLAQDGARRAELRARHAAHFSRQWAALAPHARADPRPLVDGVHAEYANGRAAWQHAAERGDVALVDAMVGTWRAFYENRARLVEGITVLRLALALPVQGAGAAAALAKLRHALSSLLYRQGDLREAQAIAEAALPLAEACGERAALKGCLGNIGLCLWHGGRPAEALAAFERALALAEQDGDRHGIALALSHLAIAEKALGRYERALALNAQALAIERELGNQRGVASKLNNIGNLYRALDRWLEARQHFVEGLEHCREYALVSAAPYLRLNLGLTETELGNLAGARAHLQAVQDALRTAGQLQVALSVELGLARIDIAERDERAACTRLQRVVRQAAAKAFHTHPVQAASIYGELLAARGQVLDAAGVWWMASREAALDEMDRQGALKLLAGLALDEAQMARVRADAPTLAQVLARLESAAG